MARAFRRMIAAAGIALVAMTASAPTSLAAIAPSVSAATVASVRPINGQTVGVAHPIIVTFTKPVADLGSALGRRLSSVGVHAPRLAEMWRSYASLAGAPNRKAFVRTIRTVIEPGGQVVSALDRLYMAAHLPTLIIWGERDEIIPVSHAHVAHDAIPGSRLVVLDGVGHFPHLEAPAEFLDVLTDFLVSTEPAAGGSPNMHDLLSPG